MESGLESESGSVNVKKLLTLKKKGMVTSLHRNSLIDDRRTLRPSADREYGVSPDPLN